MLLLGTWNTVNALPVGMQILKDSGTALDAVEAAIRVVEADLDEHTVGVGGWPNLLGEVELDASIMAGGTRNSGAVGALRGYAHPISVARQVMERTPHVFLVGQGAADFAKEIGFEAAETLTDVAAKEWIERVRANVPMERLPALLHRQEMLPWANLTRDPQCVHGTTNIIAIDSHGDLASAVSTSGWAWKYPGRLGDSPVIGAGNYCDSRYGAATCIGHGELAIRSSAARTAVMLMQMGSSPAEACRQVLNDLPVASGLVDGSFLTVLAVDAVGNVYSATNRTEPSEYYVMSPDMEAPQLRIGEYVAPGSGGE